MDMNRLAGTFLRWWRSPDCGRARRNRPRDLSKEWPTYGHDPGGMRFSPLTQITPANVSQLKVAWVYHMRPPGRARACRPGCGRPRGRSASASTGRRRTRAGRTRRVGLPRERSHAAGDRRNRCISPRRTPAWWRWTRPPGRRSGPFSCPPAALRRAASNTGPATRRRRRRSSSVRATASCTR